jgi:hypothetical protein
MDTKVTGTIADGEASIAALREQGLDPSQVLQLISGMIVAYLESIPAQSVTGAIGLFRGLLDAVERDYRRGLQ